MKNLLLSLLFFCLENELVMSKSIDNSYITSAFTLSIDSAEKADTLPKKVRVRRNLIIIGTSIASFSGSYLFLKNAWWKEQKIAFHLDPGSDLKYASNLDKVAHFTSGVWISEFYTDGFEWAGIPRKKAAWYGAGIALIAHLSTELKDAYAPRWGFSVLDLAAGTLGGVYTVGKQHSKFLANTTLNATYWQRSTKYFDISGKEKKWFSVDDYLNQTFWFSYYPHDHLNPTSTKGLPDWLGISLGVGIEPDRWNGFGGAKHELYLSPDIHLEKLLKPKKQPWKSLVKALNITRLPLPALQITPKVKVWGWFL